MDYKVEYTDEQRELIDETLLKGCSKYEKMQVWHLAEKYGLDLMQKGQIWVSGFGNQKNIIVGRDGMLTIAHRRGGIKLFESEPIYRPDDALHEQNPIGAYCIIERLDNGARTRQVANFKDYNTGKALWATKPSEMITKVAESKCLRRAFDMSGFYAQEELDEVKAESAEMRDAAIEEEEKALKNGALFSSRKEREAVSKPAEVPKVQIPSVSAKVDGMTATVSVGAPRPVDRTMSHCEYDLSRPYITEQQMDNMVEDVKNNFPGQKVDDFEREACRRSDGNYDREAADTLKKSKFRAWKEARNGGNQ